jgi:hypothetical protein
MAQSTEQLQVLLKDMGFEQTTPREVAQHQQQAAFGGPGPKGHEASTPGELRSGESGDLYASEDGRQSSDLTSGPPMVPAACTQRPQAAATAAAADSTQPQGDLEHGRSPVSRPNLAGSCSIVLPPPSPLRPSLPVTSPQPHPHSSPAAGTEARGESAQTAARPDEPSVRPDLLGGAHDSTPQPAAQLRQEQHQQPQPEQQQRVWRRWSESNARDTLQQAGKHPLPPVMASPFQVPHVVAFSASHLLPLGSRQQHASCSEDGWARGRPLRAARASTLIPSPSSSGLPLARRRARSPSSPRRRGRRRTPPRRSSWGRCRWGRMRCWGAPPPAAPTAARCPST